MSKKSLNALINKRITEIAPLANMLPGVVIIHDLRDHTVKWISDRGLSELRITLEEITKLTALEYHARYFNSEDAKDYVPKILGLIERNNNDECCTFFQQVRFEGSKEWTWHMSSMKLFMRDEEGAALLSITVAFPIDTMHHMTVKAARLLEENNFMRNKFHLYSLLGKREKEILRLMALGKSAAETAEELFLSLHTIETHRKNIKQKLKSSSYYELCQYATAFNLI